MKWYHIYIFRPGLDRTEANIRKHLDSLGIRDSVQNEVKNWYTCQDTKMPTKKEKLPTELAG